VVCRAVARPPAHPPSKRAARGVPLLGAFLLFFSRRGRRSRRRVFFFT